MNFKNIESFETERMIARRIRPSDFENVFRMHSDPQVILTLGGHKTVEIVNTMLANYDKQWEEYGYCYWIFFDKITSEFIGRGGLRHVPIEGQDEVELGYAVMPVFWGQGYATEMGDAAIQIAFQHLKLKNLVCFTIPTNKKSQRVMEKLGFIYERDFVYSTFPHVLYRLKHENDNE